ncbi:MAG TPA: hypothetical protein VFB38_12370 [Chthonomonadaceae bacterium]|nr:hypothetical protein [Chthonomonadaceae bacterium]
MPENKPEETDPVPGVDLHPRHESWARLTTRNSMIGCVIAIVLAILFYFAIKLVYRGP